MNRPSYILLLSLVAVLTASSRAADTTGVELHVNQFCQGVANGRFVANPRSCQHWIFCQNQNGVEGQCPDIFYFDEDMQMCRYPIYVQCDFDSVDIVCPVDVDFELHPHPRNCDQYVACINGFARVINCAPNLHWNPTLGVCDLPENAQCTIEDDIDYYCDPSRNYLRHHPSDCQQFIICISGERRMNRCAETLLFDPVNLRCDFPENVNCEVPADNVQYECNAANGIYLAPHPNYCENFILCVNGQKQVERCADGLIFDNQHLRCDMPENVLCLV